MLNSLSAFLSCVASLLAVAAAGFLLAGNIQWGSLCGFAALVFLAPAAVRGLERRWDTVRRPVAD